MTTMTLTIISMAMLMATTKMSSSNPMKVSIYLLIMVCLSSMFTYMNSNSSWYPLMFPMIYSGGVVLTFMILSSLSPNSNFKNIKVSKMIVMAVLIMAMTNSHQNNVSCINNQTSIMPSTWTMIFLVLCTALYFQSFLETLSEESLSMRTLSPFCSYMEIL